MLMDLPCSARETTLWKASGRKAAKSKLSLFVLTSSDRAPKGAAFRGFHVGFFPLGGGMCLQLPAAPPALPALRSASSPGAQPALG